MAEFCIFYLEKKKKKKISTHTHTHTHTHIMVYEFSISKSHKKCGEDNNSQVAILTNNIGMVVIRHPLIMLKIIITQ